MLLRLIEVLCKLDALPNSVLPQRLAPSHDYSLRDTHHIFELPAVQLELCQWLYIC